MTKSTSALASCLALLSLLVAQPTLAQEARLAGRVLDVSTGEPLPGANVLVDGLRVGATSADDGAFRIDGLPDGKHRVTARFVGYRSVTKEIVLAAGQAAELTFELRETVLSLDDIVVTGAGVATERVRLGNTVSTIDAGEFEEAPVQSLSEILQARTPGVEVLPSGGLTGEGARIRIRGSASLSMSNEPLLYVDGIRVDNGGGFAGHVHAGGGGNPSRLDDINPESIERIEILKGAAAATLYGTQASNGVIQIFTKQGRPSGRPKFDLEVETSLQAYPRGAFVDNTGFART